jgi:anti-sigma regulatory factor (Ser/Thr protein kinase)
MTPERLRIIYADRKTEESASLVRILEDLGHEVSTHDEPSGPLAESEPDIYLLGQTLASGGRGLDLLQSLRRTGRRAPILLLDEKPSFDDMRRAVELGATDMLLKPFGSDDVSKALERAHEKGSRGPRIDVEPRSHSYTRSYQAQEGSVGQAARELSAFLLNEGVVNAHRVRIASALAELVDNAARYAYKEPDGEINVSADVVNTRVFLTVKDTGIGFDASSARLECVPAALPGRASSSRRASSSTGLGRVERLCEGHDVDSGPAGTSIELTFELTPVRFDEEAENLAEVDFLDPARAHSLIAALSNGHPDLSGMPAAMALTVGRIIGGIENGSRPSSRR